MRPPPEGLGREQSAPEASLCSPSVTRASPRNAGLSPSQGTPGCLAVAAHSGSESWPSSGPRKDRVSLKLEDGRPFQSPLAPVKAKIRLRQSAGLEKV